MDKEGFTLLMIATSMICLACFVVTVDAAAPNTPWIITPPNGSDVEPSPVILLVHVVDTDEDLMNVTFHNASNDAIIGWNTVNGSGKAATIWLLENEGGYSWYANASDASNTTMSAVFNFSIVIPTKSSIDEYKYIDPPGGGLGWVNIQNTTMILQMVLKPFNDTLGDWFYVIFIFSTVAMIYIKTQRAFIPATILLLCGVTMTSLFPPEIYGAALGMIALGFSGIMFVVFKRRMA